MPWKTEKEQKAKTQCTKLQRQFQIEIFNFVGRKTSDVFRNNRKRTSTLEKLSTVIYEKTIVNTGGHYNTFDGVFVAPRSGTYFFSWTSCTSSANYAFTELMVENQLIARAGVYEHAGNNHCGSMTSLCKMNKEDHAWIRTTPYGPKHYFYFHRNTPSSSFLGMLMSSE
ncbi:unnamed protein product [Mytilus edulis]|uniref:C1q domain-containing protein n=1 Tax=Mytilus edulis TaxID=6550 RepID=A0A8S3TDI3_MYTED|nr:unnamed protein product [Mytilus edulis]